MLVIVLMMILLVSSVSAYRLFITKNQLTNIVNNFVSALQFARLSAMTSQRTITVCARGVANQCGSNWSQGQLIIDENKQTILRYLSALPDEYQLIWRSTLGKRDALQFRANGFTHGQQGSFLICNRTKSHQSSARIVILRTGRIRSELGDVAQCDEKQN